LANRRYFGIDQSAEYVGYAQKRLDHALEQAGKNGAATPTIVFDPKRRQPGHDQDRRPGPPPRRTPRKIHCEKVRLIADITSGRWCLCPGSNHSA
jgi:hypothetical protein